MATKQDAFEWAEANKVANEIRSKLEPYCDKIMVVGSLRRQSETVHDIDIVLCPKPDGLLNGIFLASGLADILGESWRYVQGKSKIVNGTYAGIPVDLYFATPDTWWTLVVIRTGSAGHNIRLCQRAKSLGMKLHADGSGLEDVDNGLMFAPKSEGALFRELQLPYLEPRDRR
jgi:DNA polymerase/3'-5' exonuclease PolX